MLAEALGDELRTWSTVFSAMFVQALPFLVLGVVVAAAIAVFVPASTLRALLDRPAAVSLPAATLGGVALPGCECSAVPVANRIAAQGVPFSSAVAFAMASPALNPVVLVATATAFPGQPAVVVARFAASALTVLAVGAVVHRRRLQPVSRLARRLRDDGHGHGHGHGHDDHGDHDACCVGVAAGPAAAPVPTSVGAAVNPAMVAPAPRRWARFVDAVEHDLVHTAGFLVVGAAIASSVRVFVPAQWIDGLSGQLVVAVVAMAALAIVMSICSEADAFVAASFGAFPRTAQLAFMVVGPAVDLHLLTLYRAGFGSVVTRTIAATALVAGIASTLVIGTVLL